MTEKQTTPMIHRKIAAALKDVEAVEKDRRNDKQGYRYRGIDDFLNALNPLFAKHEIFVVPEVLSEKREERRTNAGGTLIYTILSVKFHLCASDGSEITSTVIGEGMDSGDKGSNKALTAAFKNLVVPIFCIPTDDTESDTERTTHAIAPRGAPAECPPQQRAQGPQPKKSSQSEGRSSARPQGSGTKTSSPPSTGKQSTASSTAGKQSPPKEDDVPENWDQSPQASAGPGGALSRADMEKQLMPLWKIFQKNHMEPYIAPIQVLTDRYQVENVGALNDEQLADLLTYFEHDNAAHARRGASK